jgi:hypothetical protein
VKSAKAGEKRTLNLIISDATKSASGSLADVRASSGTVAYLSVTVESFGSWKGVRMVAKSPGSATARECFSFDEELVAIAASASGDSWVSFSWTDSGDCSHIAIGHASHLSPKVL